MFEAFANVVPFQQLSVDAGVAIVGRLVERFGRHLEQGGRRFHAFPTAGAVAEARLEALRRCGLSPRKAESLRHLARAIESRELTEDRLSGMSTDDALRTLATRGLGAVMHLRPGASLGRIVERFGDRRGYLYFCALGGGLLARGLIQAAPPSS